MGLTGAAVGLNSSIQDMLLARMQQKQYEDKLRQQATDNAQKDREQTFNEQLRRDSLDEQHNQHVAADADKRIGLASSLGDQIPGGTFMAPDDPGVGMLQAGGRGSLLTPQDERPAVETGPLLPGDTGAAKAKGFIKTRSAKQIDTETDNERQAAQQEAQARRDAASAARGERQDAETQRYHTGMLNRPQSNATVTIQTVDDAGNPVTRVVPKSEAIGKDFKKGPSATTANRLDSAKAVQQTGEDIIRQLSDPAFIAAVGPVMGRASKLADFIGNPPPEFSGLAGQIESYALANMGVHGMRSAQGAAMISKLLDQHHTPESLIATIKGLNGFSQHFLANAGRGGPGDGGAVHMKAPDGRDLQVPAEKVAELERLGAKRMP